MNIFKNLKNMLTKKDIKTDETSVTIIEPEKELFKNSEFLCEDLFYMVYRMVYYGVKGYKRLDDKRYTVICTPHFFKVRIDELVIKVYRTTRNMEDDYNVVITDYETDALIAVGGKYNLGSSLYSKDLRHIGIHSWDMSQEHLIFVDEKSTPAEFTAQTLTEWMKKALEAKNKHEEFERILAETKASIENEQRENLNEKYTRKLS